MLYFTSSTIKKQDIKTRRKLDSCPIFWHNRQYMLKLNNKKLSKRGALKIILVTILIIGVWAGGFAVGSQWGWQQHLPSPFSKILHRNKPADIPAGDMSIFWDTWKVILNKYVGRQHLNTQKMIEGATEGLVQSLGDPYSLFLNKEQTKNLSEELSGSFYGVGMEIGKKKGFLVVVTPLPNTPAAKAGLKPNDIILKINNKDASKLTTFEAAKLIRGKLNTKVTLNVYRSSWDKAKDIVLNRGKINIPALTWQILPQYNLAYIHIYSFSKPLLTDFYQAAIQILKQPPKGIIIDVRNDPGGYLDSVVNISGWLLPKGDIILKEDLGNNNVKIYRSKGPGLFKNVPTVVLANEGTASAAEILAGALRDDRGVKIIGETTFGKGSVQELVPIINQSSVKITIAKWLTPKGTLIQGNGITPDVKIKDPDNLSLYGKLDTNHDPQLQKAIGVLLNQITPTTTNNK